MLSESIYFTLNLASFTALLWSFFPERNESIRNRIQDFGISFIFSLLFYLFSYTQRAAGKIEAFREFIFSTSLLGLLFFSFLFNLTLYMRVKKMIPLSILPFASIFLFFSFFGLETFHFPWGEMNSFSLLKTQNPLIFLSCFGIYFIRKKKLASIVFFGFLLFLLILRSYRVSSYKSMEKHIYGRYIPFEFFFDSDSYVLEAPPQGKNLKEMRGGLYMWKKSKQPDVDQLYQFDLRAVRKLKGEQKYLLQRIVAEMEFPVVLRYRTVITIHDLFRYYRGENYRVLINVKEKDVKLLGPIF